MNVEAGSAEILDILLLRGKEFNRMDPVLRVRLLRVIRLFIEAETVGDLRNFASLNLKEFDGHYQVNLDAEKRLWFEVRKQDLLITYIGSTDHKHGKKR